MLVTIHQPNYLPWSGFFHKMLLCDAFVFLDNVPFSKNSYQNRCRIKTKQGANWLTVPVLTSHHFNQATNEVQIDPRSRWAIKHWRTIQQSYAGTAAFDVLADCIESAYQKEWNLLADLNIELITRVAKALGFEGALIKASSLGVEGKQSELLASICTALGATQYLSGPSGRNYLDEQVFRDKDIKVAYHSFVPTSYGPADQEFVGGLSIIDLLANCGRESKQALFGSTEQTTAVGE